MAAPSALLLFLWIHLGAVCSHFDQKKFYTLLHDNDPYTFIFNGISVRHYWNIIRSVSRALIYVHT